MVGKLNGIMCYEVAICTLQLFAEITICNMFMYALSIALVLNSCYFIVYCFHSMQLVLCLLLSRIRQRRLIQE